VRLLVYTDYLYTRDIDGVVSADRAFAQFLDGLGGALDLVLIGRLRPGTGRSHYVLRAPSGFIPLPHYSTMARPLSALSAMVRSLPVFWRALGGVDAAWLLGPTPLTLVFALLTIARRRQLFLGVRQDFPRYVRSRHPERRGLHAAADLLEAAYRLLARWYPTVVVGSDLGRRYRMAPRRLELTVSLVRAEDLISADEALARRYDDELRVLSVGRLETEKNPVLLADVLFRLRAQDDRYRLVVCGEGELESALRSRLLALGVSDHAELLGYVPFDDGLLDVYRSTHVFLHVSWTEGLPQVLFEAFAAGLPVVATDTGGVADAVAGSALLVPPGDAAAAADAVERVARDSELRKRLITAGLDRVRAHTNEAELDRLTRFLSSSGPSL
jgi:glycosyltransferase involved in cell wall biosynthesis